MCEFLFIRVVPSILSKSKMSVLISNIIEWWIQLAWMEGNELLPGTTTQLFIFVKGR